MPFVRVRSAGENDPPHEFDVAEAELIARPFLYLVVDREPVEAPRPQKYVLAPADVAVRSKRKGVNDAGKEA